MNATTVMRRVEADAKKKASAKPVVYGTLSPGDCHRQGDIYITRLKELPGHVMSGPRVAQLAPGETQGSRHCIAAEHMNHVQFFALRQPTALDGPLLVCDGPTRIEHPEHGHVTVPKAVYAVTFQRQYAEELRRVAD